jgi:hypothetical protein
MSEPTTPASLTELRHSAFGRFWRRLVPDRELMAYEVSAGDDRCWEWWGACNSRGYGVVRWHGKLVLAHRLALRLALGRALRRGKLVLHSCHNRRCCNPAHLSEGTASRNQLDRWARQRAATLTEEL